MRGAIRRFWGVPVHQNESQIPIRVDFQKSSKHSFVVRYMLTTDNRTIPYEAADNNVLVTTLPGSDDRAHNFTFGHTWVINSTMVNSFRLLGNDVYADKPGPSFFGAPDVGINAYTYVPGYIRLIVNNAFNLGSGSFNSNTYSKVQNAGASDDDLVALMRQCLAAKKAGHGIDEPTFLQPPRPMSAIGG